MRRTAAALGVLAAVALPGCGAEPGVGADPGAPGTSRAWDRHEHEEAVLWLSFEERTVAYDGSPAYVDANGGPLVGRVVTGNGGAVRQAPGASGSAVSVAFPERCAAPTGCPRAMIEVEVPGTAAFDAGTRDLEYGATVWLERDQTTPGSNIVQQGRYGTGGGQWKLQVDSEEGYPSCQVRSGADVLLSRSRVSIADSRWHRVVCRRDERGLTIEVDGTVDRERGRIGPLSTQEPIRIGSPGVGDGDDQFHGRIDDVVVRIGR